jgi:amide synthase
MRNEEEEEGDEVFDVGSYLRSIGCEGEQGVDIRTLRKLHKRHLMAVPYNLAAYDAADDAIHFVDMDEDALFETSIVEGRGGGCLQLNRLFFRLLGELGFDVSRLAASTVEGRQNFGMDVEHMLSRVALDGVEWLVDVGYPGPSYLEPLPVTGTTQTQYSCQYRLVDADGVYALQRRGRVSPWNTVYTFRMQDRRLDEWKEFEDRVREKATGMQPGGVQGILCSRTFEDGQVVLKGRRYLVVRDGWEEVRSIVDDDEHQALMSAILSGSLSR